MSAVKQSHILPADEQDDSQKPHALKSTSAWTFPNFLGDVSHSDIDILLLSTAFKFLLFPA